MATDQALREAIDHSDSAALRVELQEYYKRTDVLLPPAFWSEAKQLKQTAVDADNQLGAKAIWCLETIGKVQDHFVKSYMHLKSKEYRSAWGELERCEIVTRSLDRHFSERRKEFAVEHCRVHTSRLQDVFHLSWGFSPGMLYKEKKCTICGSKIGLRNSCGHEVGEIYDGRMAGRKITSLEFLEISFVRNPVQKYSVFFPPEDQFHWRFSIVNYVIDGLRSPWHEWEYEKVERREDHPVFKDANPDDRCPCGSGDTYKNCHLGKEHELPHFWIAFEYAPVSGLIENRLEIWTKQQ